jgi:hypothetical protein
MNFGDNEVNLWKFHVDWADPANSTFTGPVSTAVVFFEPACSSCIVQPQTTTKLDTLSDRMMYRLAYRNLGDHESLVVNHTVTAGKGTSIRWYELRDPQGTLKVTQQGTYAPDSSFRWMGSIAMDKVGNMLLGYSVSGPKIFPSIRVTGRSASDPLHTMALEQKSFSGKGSQAQGLDRWGDYSSMSVDPSDDCTFWFTTQYLAETGAFNWHTRVVSMKFPTCGGG